MEELNEGKVPIGGWLIPVAIVLWFLSLSAPIEVGTQVLFADLFGSTSTPSVWVGIAFTAVTAVLSITSLVFFLKRKKLFKKWFVGLCVWSLANYVPTFTWNPSGHNSPLTSAAGVIICVALLLYVLRSKRVKNTFVRSNGGSSVARNRSEIMRPNRSLLIMGIRCLTAYGVAIFIWFYIWDDYELEWLLVIPLYVLGVAITTSTIVWTFGRRWRANLIGAILTFFVAISTLHLYHPDVVTEDLNNNMTQHLTAKYKISDRDEVVEQSRYAIVFREMSPNGPHRVEIYDQSGSKIAVYSIVDLIRQLKPILPNLDTLSYTGAILQPTSYHGLRKASGYAQLDFETTDGTDNYAYDYGYKLTFKDGKLVLDRDLYHEISYGTFVDPTAIPVNDILNGRVIVPPT